MDSYVSGVANNFNCCGLDIIRCKGKSTKMQTLVKAMSV